MSGLACAKCFKFLRVKKVGVTFEEGMPSGRDGEWKSCKLWYADLCECPDCGAQTLLTGTGQRPIAEHYLPGYAEALKRFAPLGRVDDCGGKKP
jgi:hypothetical protein